MVGGVDGGSGSVIEPEIHVQPSLNGTPCRPCASVTVGVRVPAAAEPQPATRSRATTSRGRFTWPQFAFSRPRTPRVDPPARTTSDIVDGSEMIQQAEHLH